MLTNYLDNYKLTFKEIMTGEKEQIMNIKTNPNYVDERGSINMVLENEKISSISRIECLPGSFRAAHYHPVDQHFILINEGQIKIYERPHGSEECPKLTVLNKGDIHLTPPQIDHLMQADVYTVFDCYSLLPRTNDNYEKETIKLDYNLKDVYEEMTRGCGCR